MNKLRTPVIFEIDGTSFEVDIDKQVLRQTNDSTNEISFIRDMTEDRDFYWLFYNPVTKERTLDFDDRQSLKTILVPHLIDLDPEGMAAKYDLTIEQLKGKTDFEVIVDQHALYHRLNGILPQLSLAGDMFTVDLRNDELRHSQNSYQVISLKNFDICNNGIYYEAYYHPVMKQIVEIDPRLLEFPEGVVKIRIPNEIGLDPVGAARKYSMNERELLRSHPIQVIRDAEVIPLSETHIPALIRRNKEALQQEHRDNAQRIRPKHRPKF